MQDEREYAALVKKEQSRYNGRMKIWLGIEQDYYGVCGVDYDYRLGAVHYLDAPDGQQYSVDHNRDSFEAGLYQGYGGNIRTMARAYYERVISMCERLDPDIIAHFNLISKFNEGNRYFDEDEPYYRRMAEAALEVICDGKRLLEINTGAMARGWRSQPYPTLYMLKIWRQRGGRVIFGSDCHDAEKLLCGYDDALALLKQAGFSTLWRLGDDQTLFIEEKI